jgi:hypothetical protein
MLTHIVHRIWWGDKAELLTCTHMHPAGTRLRVSGRRSVRSGDLVIDSHRLANPYLSSTR